MLERRSFNGMLRILFSSRYIDPAVGSTNLNIDEVIVDFPAPVLPTTPIFSPGIISRVRLRKTDGRPAL
jgi:hypothetical protein